MNLVVQSLSAPARILKRDVVQQVLGYPTTADFRIVGDPIFGGELSLQIRYDRIYAPYAQSRRRDRGSARAAHGSASPSNRRTERRGSCCSSPATTSARAPPPTRCRSQSSWLASPPERRALASRRARRHRRALARRLRRPNRTRTARGCGRRAVLGLVLRGGALTFPSLELVLQAQLSHRQSRASSRCAFPDHRHELRLVGADESCHRQLV